MSKYIIRLTMGGDCASNCDPIAEQYWCSAVKARRFSLKRAKAWIAARVAHRQNTTNRNACHADYEIVEVQDVPHP